MPGMPVASVAKADVSNIRGYGVLHHPSTHWYFKFDGSITLRELARKLEVESSLYATPIGGIFVIDTGPPEGEWEVAYVVHHTEDTCVFAVLMPAVRQLKLALEFAKPHWPFGETIP
jgi:hypothetical protein